MASAAMGKEARLFHTSVASDTATCCSGSVASLVFGPQCSVFDHIDLLPLVCTFSRVLKTVIEFSGIRFPFDDIAAFECR